MNEVARILQQADAAYNGAAWHGPSVRRTLDGVSADEAARHPVRAAHSIWELVGHIAAWKREVASRLRGRPSRDLQGDANFPPPAPGESWSDALRALEAAHADLRTAIAELAEDRLDESLVGPDGEHTIYATAHGIIQHDLYHAGQIALLRKA